MPCEPMIAADGLAWIRPAFAESDAVRRAERLHPGLRVASVVPVGFPYALFRFAWARRGWRGRHTESLLCVVDRCHGVSASLESAPLAPAPVGIVCPEARFEVAALAGAAWRQAMQVHRGRLRRRGAGMTLVASREVLKPLWRIGASVPRHGDIALLIDGLSGGYYLLEDTAWREGFVAPCGNGDSL